MTRVAVTGIGMVTPLGAGREATWLGIRSGATGLRRLPAGLFPGSSEHAGGLPPPEVRPLGRDRFISYAVAAAREAAADARLAAAFGPERIACVIGSSKGGVSTLAEHLGDPRRAPADLMANCMACMASVRAAEALGLEGPVLAEAASCATGVACLLRAARMVEDGRCDAALAGSSDASLSLLMLAGFASLGALSRSADPATACKPFDARRDGFLIGEGAAVFALEPLESARRRGAAVYGVLLGLSAASEGYHQARPDPSGSGLLRAIRACFGRSGASPEAVDYVNAHGTGTRLGDAAEARALRAGFGRRALVSSTKPQTGHLLGASSSVEVGIALLALRDGWVPGTLNLEQPDEACRLNFPPPAGCRADLRCVASVSAGFGGQVGVVIAARPEGLP